MKQMATCKSKCASCGKVFGSPHLGDFAYGQAILTGTRGSARAYLHAIDNEACEIVGSLIPDADTDTFWEVVARLADPIDGQSLTMSHVCPYCQSSDVDSWPDTIAGSADVPCATFGAFLTLAAEHQKQRIGELIREIKQ